MQCDMLVALPRATGAGETLFGHNCNRPSGERVEPLLVPGRAFTPGESVTVGRLRLPQVRRTWTVLAGCCPGQWGYPHGLNEHGVAIGLTTIRTRPRESDPALTGPDLVRLGLERANSARQAVDVITDLASRHGQGSSQAGLDPAFLVADSREAFVVEMFGRHWAVQHVGEVRAASDVCHLRQDWDHLSHGLADLAIAEGWWPSDGSKLDFAGTVGAPSAGHASSLRRWGRATLLLEQSNGQISLSLLRRVLSDHFEVREDTARSDTVSRSPEAVTLCRHAATPSALQTAASLITQVGSDDRLPVAWYSLGSPCQNVYFPLFLVGDLPSALPTLPGDFGIRPPDGLRAALVRLQARFDQETREFLAEACELRQRGESERLPRLAELFMQHNLESWDSVRLEFAPAPPQSRRAHDEDPVHFSGAWS
jgi:secernin